MLQTVLLALLAIPPRAIDLASDGPPFRLILADGSAREGVLAAFSTEPARFTVRDAQGKESTVPLNELFKLEQTVPPILSSASREARLILAGGDQIPGRITRVEQDVAQLKSQRLGGLEVPLDVVLGYVADTTRDLDRRQALGELVSTEARESDAAWLANGDRLAGTLSAIDENEVVLTTEQGDVKLPRSQVQAIGLDPSLAHPPGIDGPHLELHLDDGSRISGTPRSIQEGKLSLSTGFGPLVECPLDSIASAYARNGLVLFLTEREATAAEYVEYVGPVLPYRVDRNALGQALTVSGRRYPRGIGTQSRTLLAYGIEPGDREFQASVALDDRAGSWGSVVFKVLVDGKTVFESPVIHSGESPVSVDVPIQGGRFLILATEFGPSGSVQDYADWLEARLIK